MHLYSDDSLTRDRLGERPVIDGIRDNNFSDDSRFVLSHNIKVGGSCL